MKFTLMKIAFSIVAAILGLIPTWLFLGLRAMVAPASFWQNIATGALGVWALGGLQVVGIVFFFYVLVAIWYDDV